MGGDPLALCRWWRAVQQQYDRAPESLVLRWHLSGYEFRVSAADLDAAVALLDSSAPPGRSGLPAFVSPGTPTLPSKEP